MHGHFVRRPRRRPPRARVELAPPKARAGRAHPGRGRGLLLPPASGRVAQGLESHAEPRHKLCSARVGSIEPPLARPSGRGGGKSRVWPAPRERRKVSGRRRALQDLRHATPNRRPVPSPRVRARGSLRGLASRGGLDRARRSGAGHRRRHGLPRVLPRARAPVPMRSRRGAARLPGARPPPNRRQASVRVAREDAVEEAELVGGTPNAGGGGVAGGGADRPNSGGGGVRRGKSRRCLGLPPRPGKLSPRELSPRKLSPSQLSPSQLSPRKPGHGSARGLISSRERPPGPGRSRAGVPGAERDPGALDLARRPQLRPRPAPRNHVCGPWCVPGPAR
mmetsp:Transcript_54622/g.124401  ORF Transcript_54622/g.124401 Transcript_54622/m.124401 type:complete len:336 (+) Transcript_54622:479-1486(+)